MPGQAIQVGPFIGGLNTFSDPSAVADNELVVCENFELDLDGSLKSRPPIQDLEINFTLDTTGNITLLGYFYTPSAAYLLAADGKNSTYYFDGSAWTLVTNALSAAAFTQFDDKAWLSADAGSSQTGGYWTPSGGFTSVANMPKGNTMTVYRDRIWLAPGKDATSNGTRVYISKTLADPNLWTSPNDFADIGYGDGQNIVALGVYFNTLLLFRTNSIWGLQYSTDPASFVASLIVPNVGLNSKDAIDQFESFIYFIHEDKAYEFVNNRASQINVKVPFKAGTTANIYYPFSVSQFNRRVIFTYYDVMYVYNLRTRTWTTWKSTEFGPIGRVVRREISSGPPIAVTHRSTAIPGGGSRVTPTLQITDATGSAAEDMECTLQTKNFNYQASSVYKRLFWWGIDSAFRGEVEGTVFPITYNFAVQWQTLKDKETWLTMLEYLWGQPQTDTPSVESVVDVQEFGPGRKFVKFFKSLRFRQVNFKVKFETDGSTSSAPVRVFSLMTYVNPKETVSRTVS